jgi:hypothetical protein
LAFQDGQIHPMVAGMEGQLAQVLATKIRESVAAKPTSWTRREVALSRLPMPDVPKPVVAMPAWRWILAPSS